MASPAVPIAEVQPRGRLWNLNFILLWQGQFVSAMGDVLYGIALGFWVLQKTGSTALMGALMAASTLPRIIISPFAGVLVDRIDRRGMLVVTDLVRGLFVALVGVAAYANLIDVWMVFAAGVVISAGSAFFGPAVGSTIPDIVPAPDLLKANSAFGILQTGSGIAGNAAGGFLYQFLGAPLMFLANGISYLVSAAAIVPMRIPRVRHERPQFRFLEDLRAGFQFVWQYRGIRYMFMIAAALNFFAVMGLMLLLPLFQKTPHLGAGLYGVAMAGVTGGMLAGLALVSALKIDYSKRFAVFYICGIVSMAAAALVPAWLWFPAMFALSLLFGFANAVLNSFLNATLQAAVPAEMRGKAFGLLGTLAGGLTPVAFAIAGALGEVLPLRPLIAGTMLVTLGCFLPMAFIPPIRRLVGFDPEKDSVETIR
jgi:DHA3 family macrolide efflux protein-like MFS transporter